MLQITRPETSEQFREYYDLRWRVLRAPWQQPRGSEQDEWDQSAVHICARDGQGRLLGVGRLHTDGSGNAWIRYMATEEHSRGQGVGKAIYQALESHARNQSIRQITLNARDHAVPFYEKNGFQVIGDGPTLFGEIRHKVMRKDLGSEVGGVRSEG